MKDAALRFLEVLKKDLGAMDARLQIGEAIEDGALVHSLPSFDVVALFDPPPDDAQRIELLARLAALIETFTLTLEGVEPPAFRAVNNTRGALDEALEVLTSQAHAESAFVIDDGSPEIWGCSFEPRGAETVQDAHALVEVAALLEGHDFARLLTGDDAVDGIAAALRQRVEVFRAAAPARSLLNWNKRLRAFDAMVHVRERLEPASGRTRNVRHEASGPCIARSFGGAYHLVLVFTAEDFSELHAEAAMIHALPWIAKLVGALPPVDPGGGARVLKMRHLRPV